MRSATPKVLHEVGGRSLVGHVLAAVADLDPEHLVVVVGHGRDRVAAHLAQIAPHALTVVQEQQNGTGHAMRVALEGLAEAGVSLDGSGPVLVVAGDTPLLTGETLRSLVDTHAAESAASTVLTAVVDDPTGYGRVLRDTDERPRHRDRRAEGRRRRPARRPRDQLGRLRLRRRGAALRARAAHHRQRAGRGVPHRRPRPARRGGLAVAAVAAPDPDEILGVNDRAQLAEARALLRDRVNAAWMKAGVTIVDPATTWIDADVLLERDCVIDRNTGLHGRTSIATGAVVGPDTDLTDVVVLEGASVVRTHGSSAEIGPGRHRRSVHLHPTRHPARREGQARRLRRGQERHRRRRARRCRT